MTEIFKSVDGLIELRCGRWQRVLADVTGVGSMICDPPYSSRTAAGFKSNPDYGSSVPVGEQAGISYGAIKRREAFEIAAFSPRVRWLCVFGCHVAARWHEAAALGRDRYTFAPVPYIRRNAAPRFLSDGPQSSADYLIVSRIRKGFGKNAWRSLPGYYMGSTSRDGIVSGAKDLETMCRIVRDYSNPGDLVADLYAGGATTLIAAAIEGRRSIGAEVDPETYAKAVIRIKRGYTPSMVLPTAKEMKQETML